MLSFCTESVIGKYILIENIYYLPVYSSEKKLINFGFLVFLSFMVYLRNLSPKNQNREHAKSISPHVI